MVVSCHIFWDMTDKTNKIFYEFLDDSLSMAEFESFVYSNQNLEREIGEANYLDLVSINYKDKEARKEVTNFIHERLIGRGQLETTQLRDLLQRFLEDPKNADKYLDKLYHLYCGELKENGSREYEFKFLENLALNYLWWIDEGYMKTNHGDNWEKEYNKALNEVEFYQRQLKPFAEQILKAVDEGQIEILNNGSYEINQSLKEKLESNNIYKLEHPTVR